MPPTSLFDMTGIDLDRVLYDREAIRACNPQRGDMEMLDAIVHAKPESGQIIGYKDIRPDEFWVQGHIPGRPLFPGVLMIEAAAQEVRKKILEGREGEGTATPPPAAG